MSDGFVIGAMRRTIKPRPLMVRSWATGDYMNAGWSSDPGKAYVYKTWKEAFADLCWGRSFKMTDVPPGEVWWTGNGNWSADGWDCHVFTVEEMVGVQLSDRV